MTPLAAFVLVLRVTAVLAVGLALARLLRRRSASLRHAVLTMTIVAAALTPALTIVAPAWMPLAFSPSPAGISTDTVEVTTTIGQVAPAAARDRATGRTMPDPLTVLAGVWLLASGLALTRLAHGLVSLRRLRRASQPVDDRRVHNAAAAAATTQRVTTRVVLHAGRHVGPIFTWGMRRPHILLPAEAANWPAHRLRIVLAHEFAHVARRDWGWLMAIEVARAVYVWHPLMWVAARAARREAEHAADDLVLASGEPASSYAEVLLDLARVTCTPQPTLVTAITPVSFLERRIAAMLDTTIDHRPPRRLAPVLLASAVAVSTIAVAGLGAQPAADATGTLTAVVRPNGGTPLDDVEVRLVGPSGEQRLRTDARGELTATLPAGSYTAAIRKPGFKPFTARLDIVAGTPTTRDFALALGTVTESISVAGEGDPGAVPMLLGQAPPPRDITASVVPPLKTRDVRPTYPAVVRDGRVEGPVVLSARIGADGHVTDVAVVSSPHPDLSAAAIEAVEQWRYEPTLIQGGPVSTEMTVTIAFHAPDG